MWNKFGMGSVAMCAMVAMLGFMAQARTFEFKQFKSTGSKANSEYYWMGTEKSKSSWYQVKIGGASKIDDMGEMEIRAATVLKNVQDRKTGINDVAKFRFDPINKGKAIYFMVSSGIAFSLERDKYWYGNDGRADRGWQLAGCIIEIWQKGKVVKHWSGAGNAGKMRLADGIPLLRINKDGYASESDRNHFSRDFDNPTKIFSVDQNGERVDIDDVLEPYREGADEAKADSEKKSEKKGDSASEAPVKKVVASKLRQCDFLLNEKFKKNAKFYLCLFSASWCPPCRREMPRIAETYAETLKDDPDIELIHFSRDQDDEKALAWAKEHDVKFPVVKPKGGNPLDLHTRGIPHLFIVKADGTVLEEGHPMRIFNEEKFSELKGNSAADARIQGDNGNVASCKGKESCRDRTASKVLASNRCFVTKEEIYRLLTSAQPRQKIVVPYRDSQTELPVFTNPAEAQRKAKELGLWMFVYNMPCSRSDTFSSSSYFLKSLSKHCVFVHVKGFGSESAECPWERSTCWPCCRILDSDGKLISSFAKWSGMPNCEVSGQKMAEIFKGFMTAFEVMPAAFDAVERDPDETGLAKLHDALSSLPESFVNIVYLKWAELLVKVDQTGSRGWRSFYSYADKIRPLQDEFRRADDCRFNNDYWRAKRDKKKYHDFLTGIDRVAFERRISTIDDIQRRIASIDEQGLSDEAQYRLEYLRKEVKESKERLGDIQKDLSATEK